MLFANSLILKGGGVLYLDGCWIDFWLYNQVTIFIKNKFSSADILNIM